MAAGVETSRAARSESPDNIVLPFGTVKSRMAGRILGMGDVLTLIEKAQSTADEKEAEKTAKRLLENKFDMNDLLAQLAQLKKMGGAGALMAIMPGGARAAGDVDDRQFVQIEAIIQSMTKQEREKPSIIKPPRKRRIAAGSGTKVEDVNRLLRMYEQMGKMMKQFKKNPKALAKMAGRFGI